MWKRVIAATVLVLGAGAAFADDAQGTMPTRTVSKATQSAAVRDLTDRVSTLARKVDQLTLTPPALTREDRQLAQRRQENDARLVRHAWTDGG